MSNFFIARNMGFPFLCDPVGHLTQESGFFRIVDPCNRTIGVFNQILMNQWLLVEDQLENFVSTSPGITVVVQVL